MLVFIFKLTRLEAQGGLMAIWTNSFKYFLVLALTAGILAGRQDALQGEQQQPPTLQPAVPIFDPNRASPGYTLIIGKGDTTVNLVDIYGQIVNRWQIDTPRARLLPKGNLLALHGTNSPTVDPKWRKLRRHVREYDRLGKVLWNYKAAEVAHHDIYRLENGNTLFLIRAWVPEDMKPLIADPLRRERRIRSDAIIEVTPDKQVVWSWQAHEHMDLNSCGRSPCPDLSKRPGRGYLDWTHINTAAPLPDNKWYRSGDERFRPGNILIMPRSWSTVLLIDRASGEIVWEYVGNYKGGLDAAHEPIMVPDGYPGAGNILIFDNGRRFHPHESYILEVNPVTNELVWVYDVGRDFYSLSRGAVQRLPNGNTLISEDNKGRCFEVTPDKEIVWQYQHNIEINRCERYPSDYWQH